ncbi:MAG: polysaccharide deacetylase family protein [Actinobacteria bacterium]|nr:polysaccharide deacetylase family protein [Actinomycetota bacterium]
MPTQIGAVRDISPVQNGLLKCTGAGHWRSIMPGLRRPLPGSVAVSPAMPSPPTPRDHTAVSQAQLHRRRRRRATAIGLGLLVIVLAVGALTAGSSGSWDPAGLKAAATAAIPEAQLQRQAATAKRAADAARRERSRENAAVSTAIRTAPYVSAAGAETKRVALTFDDGPSPYTRGILDTLARFGAHATFFNLGYLVTPTTAATIRRVVAEGHVIGDHSWDHTDFTKLPRAQVRAQLVRTNATLSATGAPPPRLFRPPYGAFNPSLLAQIRKAKMLTILWSIDTADYSATDPAEMAQQVLSDIKPGSIILMHDGGGNRTTTSNALPLILKGLKERGYEAVTVPQLLVTNPPSSSQQSATPTPAP